MSGTALPSIYRFIKDSDQSIQPFLDDIESTLSDKEDTLNSLLDYPVVYIHVWQSASDERNHHYSIYIGESNDIIRRTKQHYETGEYAVENNKELWQKHLISDKDSNNKTIKPILYVISHKEEFNKSMTLDIENKLINYCCAIPSAHIYNGRGNPQGHYSNSDLFDHIFDQVWSKLNNIDSSLFIPKYEVEQKAIYKVSPYHKLTDDQKIIKKRILDRVYNNIVAPHDDNQLVFVDGEAGTGKTVLISSTFYEFLKSKEKYPRDIECYLLVNHDELLSVYTNLVKKMGLQKGKAEDIVMKPTTFINNHDKNNIADVVFVDEGHLLFTQGKQSYRGNNQLKDIIERSKMTVVMFDEMQIIRTEEYWEPSLIEEMRQIAEKDHNHLCLSKQLRMKCNKDTMDWIDAFTKDMQIKELKKDDSYMIKICDTPEELHSLIKEKASKPETALSRLIATYDWEYTSKQRPKDKNYWCVEIGNWSKPWNRELPIPDKQSKDLAWAEQPQTIEEVGSTFTIQGFDLQYSGVILGPSIKYKDGKIFIDPKLKKYKGFTNKRTLSDSSKQSFTELLSKNELRILMTRATDGLFIYACDDELRKTLKNHYCL